MAILLSNLKENLNNNLVLFLSAPISLVIPYLAWNPLSLLVIGYLFLNEIPSYYVNFIFFIISKGILGCIFVLLGA